MPPSKEITTVEEALQFDISLLRSLLRRNRLAHHRTPYHRRLQMSLSHIDRCCLARGIGVISRVRNERLKRESEYERRRMSKREEPSCVSEEGGSDTRKTTPPPFPDVHASMASLLHWLNYTVFNSLPAAVSRLEDACDQLMTQITVGFYLPLCSVALAAAARIRVILLRTARDAVEESIRVLRSVHVFPPEVRDSVRKYCVFTGQDLLPFMEPLLDEEVDQNDDDFSSKDGKNGLAGKSVTATMEEDIGQSVCTTEQNHTVPLHQNQSPSPTVNQDRKTTDTKKKSALSVIDSIFQNNQTSSFTKNKKKRKKDKKKSSGSKKQKKRNVMDDIFGSL